MTSSKKHYLSDITRHDERVLRINYTFTFKINNNKINDLVKAACRITSLLDVAQYRDASQDPVVRVLDRGQPKRRYESQSGTDWLLVHRALQ